MTGPNTRPTLRVPRDCMANSTRMTTTLIGSTYSRSSAVETSRPSTADSTEIAGVITPSPKNRQAPAIPTRARALRVPVPTETRCANAISARMPPSPRLSACMISVTYFIVTISTSDQKMSERMPMISVVATDTEPNICRLALNAYSGLVPMSPYTTPSTASSMPTCGIGLRSPSAVAATVTAGTPARAGPDMLRSWVAPARPCHPRSGRRTHTPPPCRKQAFGQVAGCQAAIPDVNSLA